MTVVLLALLGFLAVLAVPYLAPRLGVALGVAGLALSSVMMLREPTSVFTGRAAGPRVVRLDFDLTRPIGIALGLCALLWLVVAAIQLARRPISA